MFGKVTLTVRAGRVVALVALGALLVQLLVSFASVPVSAQEAEPPVPPEALSSPRATVRTFLEAFYVANSQGENAREALERAAATLDLSSLPARYRTERGIELATQLKDVVDRIKYIRYSEVPDTADGEPWVFYQSPEGVIAIEKTDVGTWLFSTSTVQSIPALHREFGDRPLVAGARATNRIVTLGAWIRAQMPEPLQRRIFLLENWQWVGLGLLLVLGWLVGWAAKFIVRGTVFRLARRRFDTLTPALERRMVRPVRLIAMAIVWAIGLAALSLPPSFLSFFGTTFKLLIALGVLWLAYLAVDIIATYVARRGKRGGDLRVDDLLVPFIRAILQIIVIAIGLVVIAENFGVEVTGILAGLGLGGIAIALAAQDTLGNFFGSLAILMERPFRAGDFVKIDKVEGTVVEVGLRSTRIRTPDESIVTLPNSTLAKSSVDNLGARAYRRWFATIGVTYDTPPDKIDAFCNGIREMIVGRDKLRQDVVQVSMYNFGPSSLDIRLVCYFETSNFNDELAARHQLALDIMRLANDLGVEFAFPTSTVHFHQSEPIAVVADQPPVESRA